MKKNVKMNAKSIKALKAFNERQIKSNIKLYIFFLSMISVINVGLFHFIILYKNKISEIKVQSNQRTSSIKISQKNIIHQQNSIQHKLVNIFSVSNNDFGNPHFSFSLEKSEEVSMIKNYVSDFTKIDNIAMVFAYQGMNDSDDSKIILDIINYIQNTLFLIGVENGYKFGFFSKNQYLQIIKDIFHLIVKDALFFL